MPRRKTVWHNGLIFRTVLVALGQDIAVLSPPQWTNQMAGLTLIWTIGTIAISSQALGTAPDVAIGVAKRTQGSTPAPDTAVDFPWIWWYGGACDSENFQSYLFLVNSKAMRKFDDPDDDIVIVIKNADATDNIIYTFGLRTLYKLP